jgi:hypothetical protein
MSIHNLLYNLSIYHGAKRILSYSFSVICGIILVFNFGYLNAFSGNEKKNVILIGVENLKRSHLNSRKTAGLPALKELTARSYRFSNCFSVSNDPRVSLLSVLTSIHPEKGNYLGGIESYGLEEKTVFSMLNKINYRTGIFSDRKLTFDRINGGNDLLIKYPTHKELLKAEVLAGHFIAPVIYNNAVMLKYFSEALLLDQYRDKTYLKGKVSDIIRDKRNFMLLYTVSDHSGDLPFPYYRTSRFESGEDAFLNYLNDEISYIYERLKAAGKLNDTVICLFGLPSYSNSIKAGNYRIPLIISSPDFDLERTVKNDYSSLDILPTVLDAAGIEIQRSRIDGISFFDPEFVRQDIIITDVTPARLNSGIFFRNEEGYVSKNVVAEKERYPLISRGLIRGDYKLSVIPGPDGVKYELYDIAGDPGEKEDLFSSNSPLAGKMKAIYEEKLNKEFNFRLINGYALK